MLHPHWMIAAGKLKNELKSDVNSRLKSDPIIDIDFSSNSNINPDIFVLLQYQASNHHHQAACSSDAASGVAAAVDEARNDR